MHISTLPLILFLLPTTLATNTTTVSASPYPYPTTTPDELLSIHQAQAQAQAQYQANADAAAAPLAPRANRKPLGVYVCTKDDYKGNCWWGAAKGKAGKECQNWDEIRSFGPDNGLACDLFHGENCGGKPVFRFVTWPGEKRTRRGGLKSWRCGSL